jgi:hypothetical protein
MDVVWEMRNLHKILAEKPEGTTGRLKRTQEKNIHMDLK